MSDDTTETENTTANVLEQARQAHAEAVGRHGELQITADRASAAHATAATARRRLLDDASTGVTVSAEDLASATAALREAEDQRDLAVSIAAGAVANMERAHIGALHAEGAGLLAQYQEAVAQRIAKAEAVDRANAALQLTIQEFNYSGLTVSVAGNGCRLFSGTVAAAATSNATLAHLDPSLVPHARLAQKVTMRPVRAAFVTSSGELTEEKIVTLAERERSLFNIPALDAAAKAAAGEAAEEFRALVRAQVQAGLGKGSPSFTATEPGRLPR